MTRMAIGIRGRGVLVISVDPVRLLTTQSARRYAQLLDAAVDEIERQREQRSEATESAQRIDTMEPK